MNRQSPRVKDTLTTSLSNSSPGGHSPDLLTGLVMCPVASHPASRTASAVAAT
jgi:hypothetical protein